MKNLKREKCGVCNKSIYIYDIILVCAADGKSYHSKCLKIDRDVACEIQCLTDWFCPLCLENIFPCFNSSYDYTESQKCNSYSKFLSNRRHKVSYCIKCKKVCHDKCIERSFCKVCLSISYVSPVLQNFSNHFDPFNIEDDNEHDFYFNDDVDYTNYTTEIAKDILKNCNYHNSDSLPLPKLNNTTLYFNNIDGFKTNFGEFLSNRILHNHNFHFYCFNETNIHENCAENFEIEGYTSEFLHAIEGKSKRSGWAIYCHQNVKFQRLAYLTGRNKYFKSLGGNLNLI